MKNKDGFLATLFTILIIGTIVMILAFAKESFQSDGVPSAPKESNECLIL